MAERFGNLSDKGIGLAAGLAALAVGAVAAGFEVQSRMQQRRRHDLEPVTEESLAVPAQGRELITPDGVRLHIEIDEPAAASDDLTVVWVHGLALNLDNWYLQRQAFSGRFRGVYYDLRSHGRSSRSTPGLARVSQLGADLEQLIEEIVGDRPVILVGHSMGAMAIMNLARRRPEWFDHRSRVRGVALLNTSSGAMARHSVVPGIPGGVFSRMTPPLLTTLSRLPSAEARARRWGVDVGYVVTRRFGFGRGEVAANKIDFAHQMLQETPLQVVADFYPGVLELDESDALPVLSRTELLIVGAGRDRITPYAHSETIMNALPGASALRLADAGHLSMIEADTEVNAALEDLLARVRARGPGRPAP